MTVITLSRLTQAMYSRRIQTTRSYCMDLSMEVHNFDNIFYFKTKSIKDIGDDSTQFYVNEKNWPDISFSEALVSNNGKMDIDDYILDEKKVKKLGPAWLANNMTNGINKSSNIFANENDLIKQYISLDNNENIYGIKQLIQSKLIEAGNIALPLNNSDNSKKNITKDILDHFRKSNNPKIMMRLVELINNRENTWIPIQFKHGDIIQFDIIYDVNKFCKEQYKAEDQDYKVNIRLI